MERRHSTRTFDETHATHVSGQIIHLHRAFADAMAVVFVADVQTKILHAGNMQIPFVNRLFIHHPQVGETFLLEIQARLPAINPPPPVMTIRSSFCSGASFSTTRLVCSIFLYSR